MSTKCGDKCLVCGSSAEVYSEDSNHKFVECNVCGRFMINEFPDYPNKPQNKNKLAHYLYYNGIVNKPIKEKKFFNFIGLEDKYNEVVTKYPYCTYVTDSAVENWYPKSFTEKIDLILLGLWKFCRFYGDVIILTKSEAISALFVNFYNEDKSTISNKMLLKQTNYIVNYLYDIEYIENVNLEDPHFTLKTAALTRIDELQKKQPNNKNVFVAMSFDNDMEDVREEIKAAIEASGYIPRIMDEIQHNHQIVPEMLYEIRQAKFVIAELTGHNNGAYFEAGYALGLGKEVIQVCKKDAFGVDGHFDVKQINTVLWEKVDDVASLLEKRIKSTIS